MKCSKCCSEVDSGAAVCGECGQSPVNTKQKVYWLSTLSALLLLFPFSLFVVSYIFLAFDFEPEGVMGEVIGMIGGLFFMAAMVSLPAAPLCAITSLIRIYRSGNRLTGIERANYVIAASSFVLLLFAPISQMSSMFYARRVMCGFNLRELGTAVTAYAADHNGALPKLDRWCDLLVARSDGDPAALVCEMSGAVYGESSFAINKHITGMKYSEVPMDMVVMFEASFVEEGKERDFSFGKREFAALLADDDSIEYILSDMVYEGRWNQIGGPEMLEVNNHDKCGSNILFGDGHVEFVKLEELAELRWMVGGEAELPDTLYEAERNKTFWKQTAILTICLLVLVGTVVILFKWFRWKYFWLSVMLSIVSSVAGSLLGSLAEELYIIRGEYGIGTSAGGVFGLAVGLCYCSLLTGTVGEIKDRKAAGGYAVSLGMAAGVICSTLVHVVLMIMHEEPEPWGIYAGMPFGIFAGAVLGAVSGRFVRENSIPIEKTDGN